jgi:putative PIN family toxin of toxin-antitoxin system
MRAVLDTSTVVSALLWHGPSRQVLNAARAGSVDLFTSAVLLAELEDVLERPKFARRLAQAGASAHDLALGYAALALPVQPAVIDRVILEDPDDDAVVACAVAAGADVVLSGDSHLLALGEYHEIRIMGAAQFLSIIDVERPANE